MKPLILVVGSSNTDMVVKADRLPAPGETILGGEFLMNAGGKGANQAVAAARLGGNVTFICKTGSDLFGTTAVQLFKKEGINTDYLVTDLHVPSGVALITVDKNGENCIAVASGANATLVQADLEKNAHLIKEASIVLMQLEIPISTVAYVAAMAASIGVKVVLNPAPAQLLPDALLQHVFLVTPNQTEAEMLTGIAVTDVTSAKNAAKILVAKGVQRVIITLGNEGALVYSENVFTHVPAVKVEAVDTTAAGDVFNGALVVALADGKSLPEATDFACMAAALAVTKMGAQSSAPHIDEVTLFMKQIGIASY